jgi:acyl-CoA reductase-like NAD-dependent aldehyde dehydrogenase
MRTAKKMKDAATKRSAALKTVSLKSVDAADGDARLAVSKTYKIFIGGKFPRTESGRYYEARSPKGALLANICLSSRKDFKAAVVAAREAFEKWSQATAYNRGQILYRMAEMLEGRREQFIAEVIAHGANRKNASAEVSGAIDRLVYYAGWADKYPQIFSAVNPVSTAHFNFSVPEPTGVVGIIAPEESPLLGLVSVVAPVIVGGNTCVVLASHSKPLPAVTLTEVVGTSDLPGGVLNLLTGTRKELVSQFASHMDVNAIVYSGKARSEIVEVQEQAALNIKRVTIETRSDWFSAAAQSPYAILRTQEIKTTWHPVGW